MTVLPVINREMREQARAPFTYGLRVLAALALLGVCVLFAVEGSVSSAESGGRLFGFLNCTLFVTIWLLTPVICADCISREKREGTLGLLFLTPLTAPDIVLAKGLVHGLRALMLWLAVIPVLTLPVLMGAVGWPEISASMLVNFSALCLVLATGVIASSFSKIWLRAQLLAFVLAAIGAAGLICLIGYNSLLTIVPGRLQSQFLDGPNIGDRLLMMGTASIMDPFGNEGFIGFFNPTGRTRTPAAGRSDLLHGECLIAVLSVLLLYLAIKLAAWNVRRSWRDEPPSAFRRRLEQMFFTPVLAVKFFRRWMRRKQERNPIGWLGQRAWSGRLVTWGWFAAMVSLFTLAISPQNLAPSLGATTAILTWLLIGSIAISAAGSFRRERESGMMELLLVSPMTVNQILFGRLRGLWGQFLPSVLALIAGWMFLAYPGIRANGYAWSGLSGVAAPLIFGGFSGFGGFESDFGWSRFPLLISSLMALPVIGLFYSLRRRTFISAFLATIWVGLVIPTGLKLLLSFIAAVFYRDTTVVTQFGTATHVWQSQGHPFAAGFLALVSSVWFAPVIQLVIGWWTGCRLHRTLVRRNFAFSKMTSG